MTNVESWRLDCYSEAPVRVYERLAQFRRAHPYKRVTVGGRTWRYIDCGEGPEAVLILTGTTATGESHWRDALRYGDRYRVIIPTYAPVRTADDAVEGVRAILEREGIGLTHVVGFSLGSGVAHLLLRRHPRLVAKVVMVSFGIPDVDTARGLRSTVRLLAAMPWWMIKRNLSRGHEHVLSRLPEDEASFMRAYARDMIENDLDKRTYIGQLRIAHHMAATADRPEMSRSMDGTGRVLIIQAHDDDLFDAKQREALATAYPGAKSYLFDSGGHLLALTRGREVGNVIEEFISN